jgi:hypothetical protein
MVTTMPTGLYVQVLPDGKPKLELRHGAGVTVTVTPERRFRSSGLLQSITYEQRPDITIELRREGEVELLLFDPKYKLLSDRSGPPTDGRPIKEDLDKMHAYRDAIRDRERRRVVSFAATLYPGPTIAYGDDLAAVRAWPGDERSLRSFVREHVGRRLSDWLARAALQQSLSGEPL